MLFDLRAFRDLLMDSAHTGGAIQLQHALVMPKGERITRARALDRMTMGPTILHEHIFRMWALGLGHNPAGTTRLRSTLRMGSLLCTRWDARGRPTPGGVPPSGWAINNNRILRIHRYAQRRVRDVH